MKEQTVDISHFNQSVLLSIDKSVTPEVLSKAVEQLVSQHDALRFNYKVDQIHQIDKIRKIDKIDIKDVQWEQEYGTNKGVLETVKIQIFKEKIP